MSINFDKALGIHEQALQVRDKRNEVLATNIANADTPGYKAQDIDFKAVLSQSAASGNSMQLAEFADNAMRYQATLSFLSSRFSGMKSVLQGGR